MIVKRLLLHQLNGHISTLAWRSSKKTPELLPDVTQTQSPLMVISTFNPRHNHEANMHPPLLRLVYVYLGFVNDAVKAGGGIKGPRYPLKHLKLIQRKTDII